MSFLDRLDNVSHAFATIDSRRAIETIPLDRITSDPANPRKSFDEAELEALAASIRERGVLQPITVRSIDRGQRYVVRFGDRRFRAAKIAGLETIAAIVTEDAETEEDVVDQVVENEQRVNLKPSEVAQAVSTMLGHGMSKKLIAERLSRDVATVSLYVSVSGMPELLTALLDTVGLRTVYNLYQHWKTDPARVESFLSETPAAEITRGKVDRLSEAEVSSAQHEDVEREESLVATKHTPPPKSESAPEKQSSNVTDIAVVVGGERGRLVLGASVKVLFDGEDVPRTVRFDALDH